MSIDTTPMTAQASDLDAYVAAQRLAWLDLETTGFPDLANDGVHDHRILEIAAVVTDGYFNEIARLQLVIGFPLSSTKNLCDQVVLDMHTENGLFAEVAFSRNTISSAEADVIEFLSENGITRQSSPLCGNGITFDRMFIEAQMPDLNDYLHYRQLDVSAVKMFLKTINPNLEPPKKRPHRALDDILESIEEAKHYRALLAPALAGF